ncbi:MAG: alpha/beta hydrolase family protein, partial [Alistipes onderdonkii]
MTAAGDADIINIANIMTLLQLNSDHENPRLLPVHRPAAVRLRNGCSNAVPSSPTGGCLGPEALSRAPETEWTDCENGVRGLYFRAADCDGRPARAFAYYSNPAMLAGRTPDGATYPGIVLLHGGAGRAFREWVEKWAAEGYAAIAVDLSGNGPLGAELPDGGPDLSDTQRVFLDAESGDMTSM